MSLPADIARELLKRPALTEALWTWLRDVFAGRDAAASAAKVTAIAAGKEAARAPFTRAKAKRGG
jgi:uncharacterized protein with NRDE domain